MGRLGGVTNNFEDCVTQVRELVRTLPYKARNGHCYVMVSESEKTYSVAVKLTLAVDFSNQIEIASKKIGSLWLLSKKVQSILPFFVLFLLSLYFHE